MTVLLIMYGSVYQPLGMNLTLSQCTIRSGHVLKGEHTVLNSKRFELFCYNANFLNALHYIKQISINPTLHSTALNNLHSPTIID